jgi:type III pantothenate kinase
MAVNLSRQLLIDVGNSRIKAAFCESGALTQAVAWPLADAQALPAWLDAQAHGAAQAWLVSVADDSVNRQIEQALAKRNIHLQRWRGTPLPENFRNDYAAPTLGPDRLLAALAARRRYANDILVIACFGTATTVDLVSGHAYKGGLIAPGVALMAASLTRSTAHLPLTEGKLVTVPDNTHDAIFTGICAAQRGAVAHILEAAAALGSPQLIVSGGAAGLVSAALPPHAVLPDAVLAGLAVIAGAASGRPTA